jgi:hypothetical protein
VLRDSTLVAKQIAPFRNRLYAAPSYIASHGQPQSLEALAEHASLDSAATPVGRTGYLKIAASKKLFGRRAR